VRLVWPLALGLLACGSGPSQAPEDRSHAADEVIASAPTRKEREELTRLRDEIDDAARKRVAELDAEIARLEKENDELRRRRHR